MSTAYPSWMLDPDPGEEYFQMLDDYLETDTERSHRAREKSLAVTQYVGPKLFGPSMLLELSSQTKPPKYATGFPKLDSGLGGGLDPGRVTIVAARPSHGKSAFALEMAVRCAARRKGWVVYVSAELSASEVAWRCKKRGDLAANAHLLVVEDPRPTTASMHSTLEHIRSTRDDGVAMAIFDYLDYSGEVHDNESLRLQQALAGCHQIAKHYDIPFVVVQQLGRQVDERKDPRPRLADLRWSGAAEQIASIVIMLQHKSTHYQQRGVAEQVKNKPEQWELDVFVRKNTHGALGTLIFQADFTTGRILDPSESAIAEQERAIAQAEKRIEGAVNFSDLADALKGNPQGDDDELPF